MEPLGGGLLELTASLPALAASAQPGQFAQLRAAAASSPLLRRPFSVAWTQADRCSFVLAPVGEGTRRLAALRPGDQLEALGPLGRGFSQPPPGPAAVAVAGGLGCAPFPLLVRALRRAGVESVVVLSGAASAARLYPAERYRRGDVAVRVLEATDDGSRGRHGRVTELLSAVGAGGELALYGCGPNQMLAELSAQAVRLGDRLVLVELSLEAPMGCGFGTCLGCALPVRGDGADAGGWALCCRDGPVMEAARVDWERMASLPPPSAA